MIKILTFIAISTLFAAPAWSEDWVWFHTPSKNIYCMATDISEDGKGSFVDCELITRTNSQPALPIPADCDLEWGSRFALGATGQAYLECTGDTLRSDKAFNVPYGKLAKFSDLSCYSSEEGLECTNNDGHGFKMAKGKQSLF
jgi:hypothetical protein